MTYSTRGRSLTEVILAVIFVGFLTGFICVLCIGNYYRAKRAMERQRQRRLARLMGDNRGMMMDSPSTIASSPRSSNASDEEQYLLMSTGRGPELPRRRGAMEEQVTRDADLLQLDETTRSAVNVMSV